MSVNRFAAVATGAALAAAMWSAPAAADNVSDAIAALDPAITHMRIFGEWKKDEAEGRYRAIIRREAEPDVIRFFVQKVSDDAVVSTIELSEIHDRKLKVAGYNFEIDQFGLTLFVEVGPGDATDITYEVFFNEDGTYMFQPASN
ncbi:hypothetical protein GGD81_001645 [Rhodobium orientis]|uniref:Uncharacterized protein n=1 Tax=Rhodobium orientis TaxID=34017 RepID=A0A327JSS8_9HYPH|nr:hypothetical protein [Rhodobium orientis]MBB4302615.1 hypothetical protein [Rhodobium orientis]MBK5951515.1 hypothetical protein [Rhodobium orientis]RAI29111.1 hypothetical protein CH339_03850 [Rhodobium orientis]